MEFCNALCILGLFKVHLYYCFFLKMCLFLAVLGLVAA